MFFYMPEKARKGGQVIFCLSVLVLPLLFSMRALCDDDEKASKERKGCPPCVPTPTVLHARFRMADT